MTNVLNPPIVTAINPKYQHTIKRFLKWNAHYDSIVSETDDNGGTKQEKAYDRASEFWAEIPKSEQDNILKVCPDIKGGY